MSKYPFQQRLVALVLFWVVSSANAAGGTGVYELPWLNSQETLEYHSCGCADSCWVAEVRSRKTRQLKAKLRCDCKLLYLTLDGSERIYKNNCTLASDAKGEEIKLLFAHILHDKK